MNIEGMKYGDLLKECTLIDFCKYVACSPYAVCSSEGLVYVNSQFSNSVKFCNSRSRKDNLKYNSSVCELIRHPSTYAIILWYSDGLGHRFVEAISRKTNERIIVHSHFNSNPISINADVKQNCSLSELDEILQYIVTNLW